jgi:hypothetical protein
MDKNRRTNRKTVFSLPVCETQMTWLALASEYLRKVLVIMALASLISMWSTKLQEFERKIMAKNA